MKNQECKVRPEIININSNNPMFYPFSIKVNKCNGNWKIFKRKTKIFKGCNFFSQTCFLHSGNQVSAYHAYIFTSLISRFISEACLHNLCMNRASLDRESLDRVSRTSTTLEYVLFKIANLQSIQLHLCSRSMKNTCEGVQL